MDTQTSKQPWTVTQILTVAFVGLLVGFAIFLVGYLVRDYFNTAMPFEARKNIAVFAVVVFCVLLTSPMIYHGVSTAHRSMIEAVAWALIAITLLAAPIVVTLVYFKDADAYLISKLQRKTWTNAPVAKSQEAMEAAWCNSMQSVNWGGWMDYIHTCKKPQNEVPEAN